MPPLTFGLVTKARVEWSKNANFQYDSAMCHCDLHFIDDSDIGHGLAVGL